MAKRQKWPDPLHRDRAPADTAGSPFGGCEPSRLAHNTGSIGGRGLVAAGGRAVTDPCGAWDGWGGGGAPGTACKAGCVRYIERTSLEMGYGLANVFNGKLSCLDYQPGNYVPWSDATSMTAVLWAAPIPVILYS